MADSIRKVALRQTKTSLENVAKLQEVFLRPTALESVTKWPVAVVGVGQDERFDYVQWVGGSEDKEFIGVIEIDLVTDMDEEELIYDLLDLVDDVEVQIGSDFAVFKALTPSVYLMSPVMLAEDPIIDVDRELTAVQCRFTYHNASL